MEIKTRKSRKWSANDVKLLKRLYLNEDTQTIPDKLGRSLEAVRLKARKTGLRNEQDIVSGQDKRKLS